MPARNRPYGSAYIGASEFTPLLPMYAIDKNSTECNVLVNRGTDVKRKR